ncbi:MAG: hypothetical protein IJU67_00300, partial [Lachnospiraceae bacterium]|nr:hypothetical protein [Lachnospiraceae bacterium]
MAVSFRIVSDDRIVSGDRSGPSFPVLSPVYALRIRKSFFEKMVKLCFFCEIKKTPPGALPTVFLLNFFILKAGAVRPLSAFPLRPS